MSEQLRILIADDHEVVRQGLRTVLQFREGWVVCGEARNGREAVEKALETNPHIVVMDLTMPELNGLEATRQIRRSLPNCEVLILSMHQSEQLVHEVLAAGARGYILKSDAGHAVVDAIENLSQHKPFLTAKVSELLLNTYLSAEASASPQSGAGVALTAREREVLQQIAEGKSTKEVAVALGISESTAETHRSHIMRKLGMHSVSEIVRYAIRNRIIEP